jgi:hypothetical protein
MNIAAGNAVSIPPQFSLGSCGREGRGLKHVCMTNKMIKEGAEV